MRHVINTSYFFSRQTVLHINC